MSHATRRPDRSLPTILAAAMVSALFVFAVTAVSVPSDVLGAGVTRAAACSADLRTGPYGSATLKATIKTDTTVRVLTSVTGGVWRATCNGRASAGTHWYRISAVNGKSVSSLYGVSYLYVATWLLKPIVIPTITKYAACNATLRTSASVGATARTTIATNTKLAVTTSVTGGTWRATCAGKTSSGTHWYRISAINGKSVRSLYGVSYLYAATWLLKATVTTGSSTPPGVGIPVPASIDATGATDVRAALQSFLASVPNGSTVGFHGGQYRIEGQTDRFGALHLAGRGLTLDLQGGRLFRTTRSNVPFILVDGGGTGFAIRNGTIEGFHPEAGGANAYLGSYSSNYGISIGGIANVEIGPNLTIQRFGGDAVYLNQGAGRWANGVRIHHSTLQLVGRNGISWTDGARNVVVDFNTVANTGLYAFDIEPNGLAGLNIENVRVSDNVIRRYTTSSAWSPLLFAATGAAEYERYIEFSRNTVFGQPIRVGSTHREANVSYLTVKDNTSDTAGGFLEFVGVDYLSHSGNRGAGTAVPVRITP